MRRMHRQLGRTSGQAYGINKDLLERMIAATSDDLRGIRDKALLSLAYDTLCRRSSKTDQEKLGKILEINSETKKYLCNWLQHSKINTGKLFRGIKNNKQYTNSLNKAQINKIYKKLAKKANVDKETLKKN